MRHAAIIALALAMLPATAAADWRHKPSGVGLPDAVGDMRRGEERDLSNGQRADVMVQYGSDSEPVTVYVYRSSHPNPALWFERTRSAMLDNVGGFDPAKPPRPITLGSGSTPNGLREEFPTFGKAWRATSIVIAQDGEWLVKVRITSSTMDEPGVAAKMDRLLAAMTFAKPPPAALPLVAPDACKTPATYGAAPRTDAGVVAAASVMGIVAMADARGDAKGLSGQPDDWCRDDVGDPAIRKMVSVYRRNDGCGWTALLGDAGISTSALTLVPMGSSGATAGAGLYLTRTGPTQLVAIYDSLPSVVQALGAIAPVMRGQAPPLATIGTKDR